jgi:hypothetical protein
MAHFVNTEASFGLDIFIACRCCEIFYAAAIPRTDGFTGYGRGRFRLRAK